MNIVAVNEENVAYFVQLVKELVEASVFGQEGMKFDWDTAIGFMRYGMQSRDHYMRMAQDDEDVFYGLVAGHVESFLFCKENMAIENAWFVRPHKDRAATAMALMRGFVAWATDEKKARLVQSGDIASINSVGVDALYRRLGFKRFGVIYRYDQEAA